MPSRDQRLAATKYAGKKSASQTAREKAKPAKVAEDPMETMRQLVAQPRSQASIDRARAHQRNLPPLG
jgi:hypothetical protein